MKLFSKKMSMGMLSALLIASMAACSGKEANSNKEGTGEGYKNKISIMTTTHVPEPPTKNSPAWKELEKFTDTEIDITWVLNEYSEKVNITLASGDLPNILMIEDKYPSFVSAVRDGAFWEIGPYLKDYSNLSQANEIALQNSMIDGKVYGVYRGRPLGRNGVTIRKDWLKNLGLEIPKTIDEFYNVLKAFTNDDPDGNGKDDTYGMVVSKYTGPLDIMQIWFGAPNKWGEDANGDLIPDFMTGEYKEALKFFKKIYDEGLINEDFAVMDPQKWGDPLLNGEAGVIVDVLDRAHRAQEEMMNANPDLTDPIDVLGAPAPFNLPTLGYAGMLTIPKSSVKTEEELKQVLSFIDKQSEAEAQIIAYNGVEGRHFEMKDGEFTILSPDNQALHHEYTSFNQFGTGIPEDRFHAPPVSELREKEAEVMKENEDIVVPNPAVALISSVYATKGQQLDNIINDARIQFIVGQIDEKGLEDAVQLWLNSGGKDYIDEMNEMYQEIK
ncbi:extracellular solute-binding protein [Bacillus sp. FSL K6-3431]|uniref:extracellular solute-binding protein n=1 Tax=Bacillus sp. FSL K6-3431 TaxID=2921500 RepID=UPI0030F63AB2